MCAESPFILVYACVVYAWVGGCLHGVANKRGEKKKALTIEIVSKRGSRKVIGACQRHPLSPAARCCSPASQALFSHTHVPENIHRSFLYTTEPATRSLLCEGFSFFSLLIPFPFLALSLLRSPSFGPQVAPPTQISRGQSYLPVTDCDEVWEMYTWKGPVCYVGLYHMA